MVTLALRRNMMEIGSVKAEQWLGQAVIGKHKCHIFIHQQDGIVLSTMMKMNKEN